MADTLFQPLAITGIIHLLAVMAVGMRVIMRRPTHGVAFAWLFLVVSLPVFGVLLYLLIGERRIGPIRARRFAALRGKASKDACAALWRHATDVDWSRHPPAAQSLGRLGRNLAGASTVRGSSVRLFSDTEEVLQTIARDVDGAQTAVLMAFYIWNEGGTADEVLEALIRAADRGVRCRVLIDALGSRPWWRTNQPGRLHDAGVEVRAALPAGLLRGLIARDDMRLHRKIVVVDGRIAWTGSMNLVDPRLFKQNAGVGEWIDSMARLQGPAVAPLGTTVIGDWILETGASLEDVVESSGLYQIEPVGDADVQVVPSGPGETEDGMLQMLLALINAARERLVLTTPYLVPDDSLLRALRGAAGRGVRVSIILPARIDSLPTRHASRSYYDELLETGIEIFLYRNGLLHTKSIVVDDDMSMFGSVNLDMRSLWLNYEVALFIYDRDFARELHALHESYKADSERIDPIAWKTRPSAQRFVENSFRLIGPLL